jgi:DNA-binding NarL/FixJ family response regulator
MKFTTKEDQIVFKDISRLTPNSQQSDVFHLFINGVSMQDIGTSLNIPYHTVVSSLTALRQRFGVGSSYQLLTLVIPAMIRKECEEFMEAKPSDGIPSFLKNQA